MAKDLAGARLHAARRDWLTLHADPAGDVRRAKERNARIQQEETRRPVLVTLVDALGEVLLDKLIADERKATS